MGVAGHVSSSASSAVVMHDPGALTVSLLPLPIPKPAVTLEDLPRYLTSFIGRVREVDEVTDLLATRRLVTLTGPGGCGKTRLAVKAADGISHRASGGVVWVELSSLADADAVPNALALAAGLSESPPLGLTDVIVAHFAGSEALLLLDNCEHVIDACSALVDQLLRRCGSIRVLATSREPLAVEGETSFSVPPMQIAPKGGDESARHLGMYDGIRLFVERACRVRPEFELTDSNAPAVALICERLDGLPLAIELAAARMRTMGVDQIAEGLDDRFRLLTRGVRAGEPRHRTLQASLDWSHTLLDSNERALFRRLSVFAGGFSREAAEAVADIHSLSRSDVFPLLTQLIEKSLVSPDDVGGSMRYRLLESLRLYARERLQEHPEEVDLIRDRHLAYFLGEAQRAEPGLATPAVLEWLDPLDAERENFNAALAWGEQANRVEPTARLASALVRYWLHRGTYDEARKHLEVVLGVHDLPTPLRARIAAAVARMALRQWDMTAAEAKAGEALALAREDDDHALTSEALVVLGWAASYTGRLEEARDHFGDAHEYAERSGDPGALARALCGFAQVPWSTGEWSLSRPLFERSIVEARTSGQLDVLLEDLHYLFLANWMAGRDREAEAAADEGLALAIRLRDPTFRSQFLSFLAALRSRAGDVDTARSLLDEALAWAERSGSPFPRSFHQTFLALLGRAEGDLEAMAARCRPLAETAFALGIYVPAAVMWGLAAEVCCLLGNIDDAARFAALAGEARDRAGGPIAAAPLAAGVVAFTRGDTGEAIEQCHAAIAFAVAAGSDWYALEALELLACSLIQADEILEGARLLAASDAAYTRFGWQRCPTLVARYEDAKSAARVAVVDRFEGAMAGGGKMTLEEAVGYARRGRGERRRPTSGWDSLTPAELEVAGLVAHGMSNPQIAEKMFVSRATVKAHLGHIFPKLGVTTRAELAAEFARRKEQRGG